MAHFVGLDVSVKETSVCVVDDEYPRPPDKRARHRWPIPNPKFQPCDMSKHLSHSISPLPQTASEIHRG
jgi:hypothetical protein